jgi:hypothetical protein
VLWSQMSVSAWLEYVVVKIVSFSMSGMCCGHKCQFQVAWNMSWANTSVSACPECDQTSVSACLIYVLDKNVHFSMAGMCRCQKIYVFACLEC